jgi:hypothetical protein
MAKEPEFDESIFDDPPTAVPEVGDALYFSDPIINDRNNLVGLLLLFERVFVYHNWPNYYSNLFLNLAKKNSHYIQQLVEQATGDGSVTDILTTYAGEDQKRSILLFWRDMARLREEQLIFPVGDRQAPPNWIASESLLARIYLRYIPIKQWASSKGMVPPGKEYLDMPLFLFHRFFSASAGLCYALNNRLVPISDNVDLYDVAHRGIDAPLELDEDLIQPDSSDRIGYLFALMALQEMLPPLGALTDEHIVEIRRRTPDEREAFVSLMRSYSQRYRGQKCLSDIDKEIKAVVKTELKPALLDLSSRIVEEKKRLFRRLSTKFFVAAPGLSIAANIPFVDPVGVGVAAASFIGKALVDIDEYQSNVHKIRQSRSAQGLSLILTAGAKIRGQGQVHEVGQSSPHGLHPELVAWNNRV